MIASPPLGSTLPEVVTAASAADLEALKERFGDRILAAEVTHGEPTALVPPPALVQVARFLRDERGYQLLRSVTAVDYLGVEPRFQVVYHFTALPAHVLGGDPEPVDDAPVRLLRVKVPVASEELVVPSLVDLYPTADWHERETWDLFGIEFAGHPDLRRILMPENWEGHPLRKDYPMTYEEVAFTFNADEVHGQKPFATE